VPLDRHVRVGAAVREVEPRDGDARSGAAVELAVREEAGADGGVAGVLGEAPGADRR
jgi:hypothetical protein